MPTLEVPLIRDSFSLLCVLSVSHDRFPFPFVNSASTNFMLRARRLDLK